MNAKVMERLGRDLGREFKDDVCFFSKMELEKDMLEEQNARLERFLRHPHNIESQDSLDVDYYEELVKPSYSNSTIVVTSDGDHNKVPKQFRNIFTAPPNYNAKSKPAAPNIEVNNNNNNSSSIRVVEPLPISGQSQQQPNVNMSHKKTATSRLSLMSGSRIDLSDGLFNKKFRTTIEKSIKLLNDIKHLLEAGIPPPDGEEDYQRRLKRSTEFSARFSRIYLYPLLRQVNDLSIIPSKPNYPGINHKLLSPHQTILQALQAYHSHLPSSIGKCCSDKLKTLLDQAVYLTQMYGMLKNNSSDDLNTEFTNAMLTHLELVLETLYNFNSKFDSKVCSAKEAKKAKLQEQVEDNEKRKKRGALNKTKKKSSEKKLSMYAVTASFRKDPAWKRAVESLSKKKMVKSRYKTATYKHRPPVEKPKSNCRLVENKSSSLQSRLKATPANNTPIKEDEIKTMMEEAQDSDASRPVSPKKRPSVVVNHQQEQEQHEEFATRLLQLVRDNDHLPGGITGGSKGGGGEDESAKKAAEKLGRWLMGNGDGGGVAVLTRLVQEMEAKNKAIAEENRLEFVVRTPAGSEGDVRKVRKEPTVTQIIGAKNAKLICLRDDNSDQASSTSTLDEENPKVVLLKSSKTQTKISTIPEERKHPSKSNIKISRLPRNALKPLKCLPKSYAISAIQYKLEFHKHTQQDHMYRKSANIQPWLLMSQISDEILEDIVKVVSKELEVSEILENLYNAEFQY